MHTQELNTRRTLFLLCLSSGGWAFSFGLGAPLASLWLRDAGYSARVIGLNTSLYYLGVALAAMLVPALMRRSGRACVVGGVALDAVVTALFPWTDALAGWFALRLIGGVGTALSLIPVETLVNRNAPAERRARDFGYYAFSVALGVALGSLVGLPLYPIAPRLAFALGGGVTLGAACLLWFVWPCEAFQLEETKDEGPLAFLRNSLSFGTAWVQGLLEGGLIAFLSIYLLSLDYTELQVSLLACGLFAGVIICQVPIAGLADRLGRQRVLVVCHLLLILALFGVWCRPTTVPLAGLLFLLGCCCGALYPLGLALLGERVPASGLARANAGYLASNCVGSMSGPVLFGLTIDFFQSSAQFVTGIVSVIVVLGAWQLTVRTMLRRDQSRQILTFEARRKAG